MAVIRGAGWVDEAGHGTVREGRETAGPPVRTEIFSIPFKNFGRLDVASRATAYAVALALRDAGVEYPLRDGAYAGIVGANTSGCLVSDTAYFKDYLDGNRILGRGNLFIYTLPTSPLGEAAIHFGLTGPLFYVSSSRDRLAAAFRHAAGVMEDFGLEMMLAGLVDGNAALYAVVAGEGGPGVAPVCGLEQALADLAGAEGVREAAGRIAAAAATGGRTPGERAA